MAFTEMEKSRIKRFLSYPDWVALAASIQLGFPAASQPLFLVESAFNKLTPEGEASVREDLCQCESCEKQLIDARSRFKAIRIGEIELNLNETKLLRKELLWWVTRLADDLGVVSNPYSQLMWQDIATIGGINGRSIG